MKKKIFIPIAAIILLAVLFVPISQGTCNDGGTRDYRAITYRVIKWNRIRPNGNYKATRIYWGAEARKSIDELWEKESSPIKTKATDTEISNDIRQKNYDGEWLNKKTAEKNDETLSSHFIITEIYADCFFADYVIPMPNKVKINGKLSDEWCVNDQVQVTFNNIYTDSDKGRMEVDLQKIEESSFTPDPLKAYKPVIYLYPEKKTDVSVKLSLDGALTCTYPAYKNGWYVTASPDGLLRDSKGQTYNYLYWEGEINAKWDLSRGFCVKGSDTASFLEYALEKLGLNRREANEFIVYWLPQMEVNAYNIISFQTDLYTDSARLDITPKPDTLIRVFMTYRASDTAVKLQEQSLTAPVRNGFTVTEWGGTEIK